LRKKILICFSSTPFIRGGAELHVESLYLELKTRGFEVDMVNIPFQQRPKEEILKNIITWRLLKLDKVNFDPVDLVISTKFPSYTVKHPNKVTWLIHQHRAIYDLYGTMYSDFSPDDPADRDIRSKIMWIDNKTLNESRMIYTNSKNTGKRLKQYNNIDSTPLYHPPKHYGKYYCDDYGDYILSVGRLEPIKRIDLLVDAMRYMDKGIKCVIVGTGSKESHIKNMVQKFGLQDRVKMLGFVDDEELLRLYANCFSVYYAPYDEDYGYVTIESFLSKKPIVTCEDSGGIMEFAEHDVNSKIAGTPDARAIADCVNRLYNDPATCKKFGEMGYSAVKDISWDDVINRLTATL
jgi:glycosyltransferase involved in cell wall biosynthesis